MATRLKTKTVAHAPNLGEEAHRRRVLLNAALELGRRVQSRPVKPPTGGHRDHHVSEFLRLLAELALVGRLADAEVENFPSFRALTADDLGDQQVAGAAAGDLGRVIKGDEHARHALGIRSAAEHRGDPFSDAEDMQFKRRV